MALASNSIEDVAALFFGHHDACSRKLLQMAGYDRPVLWLALRNGRNVGPAQQYNLLQHCNARGLAQRLEEACVEHGNALLRRFLARHRHLSTPFRTVSRYLFRDTAIDVLYRCINVHICNNNGAYIKSLAYLRRSGQPPHIALACHRLQIGNHPSR